MRRALPLAIWLGLAGLLLMALGPWQDSLHALLTRNHLVARVDGSSIRQSDVTEALRADLWRRGEAWNGLTPEAQQQRREAILDQLIDQQLVRAAHVGSPLDPDEELGWFQRQLGFSEGRYAQALQSQQLAEPDFRRRITTSLQDQAWIEQSIAPKLATVSEAEARAWYETRRSQLTAPLACRASHLFLSSHDPAQPDRRFKIEQLHAQWVADPASFEQLVEENSEDERTKLRGGDLGWFTRQRMPADFMAAIEKLKPGQMSGPVQTQLGWHLIKLLERKPARQLSFDEAKEEILALLTNERRQTAVAELISQLRSRASIVRNEALLAHVTVPAE